MKNEMMIVQGFHCQCGGELTVDVDWTQRVQQTRCGKESTRRGRLNEFVADALAVESAAAYEVTAENRWRFIIRFVCNEAYAPEHKPADYGYFGIPNAKNMKWERMPGEIDRPPGLSDRDWEIRVRSFFHKEGV